MAESTPASVRRPISRLCRFQAVSPPASPAGCLREEPFLDELGQGSGWKGLGERNVGCYLQIGQNDDARPLVRDMDRNALIAGHGTTVPDGSRKRLPDAQSVGPCLEVQALTNG